MPIPNPPKNNPINVDITAKIHALLIILNNPDAISKLKNPQRNNIGPNNASDSAKGWI